MLIQNDDEKITYFAETDARNKRVRFGIKKKDRSKHIYVIGKTGMGKSTLLENMAVQDIQSGEGMAFIDPHGKTAELLLDYIPEERINDVLYFAPFDLSNPISFNVMEDVGYDKRHLVVSGLMSTFKKIWQDAWSARMEYILSNTLLALLEYPNSTLLGVNRMLADKEYRKRVVDNISDPAVRSFWVDEFAKYTEKFAAEATPAIQNKIGQFTSNPIIRNIIGQPQSSFDIRKMMDEKKILIINLSKGRVGESNANLLGSMLITKMYLSAMSRADVTDKEMKKLPPFFLFVDEFQSFANESFADILSEARKYKLSLTIAHQYIEQMQDEVRAAVFGNVGSMITFRIGATDAEALEKEFMPEFTGEDIVNLGYTQIYLRLMIDGIGSKPFSARTMAPIKEPERSYKEEVIEASRKNFARPRKDVEEEIKKWHEPISNSKPNPNPNNSTNQNQTQSFKPTVVVSNIQNNNNSNVQNYSKTKEVSKEFPSRDHSFSGAQGRGNDIQKNNVEKKYENKELPRAEKGENTDLKSLINNVAPKAMNQPFKDGFKNMFDKSAGDPKENVSKPKIEIIKVDDSNIEEIKDKKEEERDILEREMALRKMISSNYGQKENDRLDRKKENHKIINNNKIASKENLDTLRNAILSSTNLVPKEENKIEEKKEERKPEVSIMHVGKDFHERVFNKKDPEEDLNNISSQYANKINEVPESVLKSLLEVEEE